VKRFDFALFYHQRLRYPVSFLCLGLLIQPMKSGLLKNVFNI